MAQWSKNRVLPSQINDGNEYTINDDLSLEAINAIVNNSFYASEQTVQVSTMPTASQDYLNNIVQYTGATDSTYTNGYFYKCLENSGTYSWVQKDVQPASEPELFECTYGTTTYAEITTALSAGKVPVCFYDNKQYVYVGLSNTNRYTFSSQLFDTQRYISVNDSNSWGTGNNNFEVTNNKVTSIDSSSTNAQYPSAKCVYDALALKSTVSVSNTGTATDKVNYITVNGVEKKLAGGINANEVIESAQSLPTASEQTADFVNIIDGTNDGKFYRKKATTSYDGTTIAGTTWQLKNKINPMSFTYYRNITFKSNNENFVTIFFNNYGGAGGMRYYRSDSTFIDVYTIDGVISGMENYTSITFTGGTDCTDNTLKTWLNANGEITDYGEKSYSYTGVQDEITSSNKLSADLLQDGSTNKVFTETEQSKLAGIENGAKVNVQADWNQSNSSADDYIKNKPTIPTSYVTSLGGSTGAITLGSGLTITNNELSATGGSGGSGITNYEVINRPNSMPTATATSPDFLQYNGSLYQKKLTGSTYSYELVGGGSGGGITDYQVINNTQPLTTPTATSPDIIQQNGKVYYKKVTENITSLAGSTWVFNDVINLDDYTTALGETFTINFSSNSNNYDTLFFNGTKMSYSASSIETDIYTDSTATWENNSYKTISIVDGTDIADSDLIDWLKANASRQSGGTVTISYSYEPINVKLKRFVTETYQHTTQGYIIYNDGYCEQWGLKLDNADIVFLKEFKDTNYNLLVTDNSPTSYSGTSVPLYQHGYTTKTATGFKAYADGNLNKNWRAFGYLAEGQYTPMEMDINAIINQSISPTPSSLNFESLWTNSSPTSSFASQKVEFADNNYKFFMIKCNLNVNNAYYIYYFCEPTEKALMSFNCATATPTGAPIRAVRMITTSSQTSITFGDAGESQGSSNLSVQNGWMVPVEIFGVN